MKENKTMRLLNQKDAEDIETFEMIKQKASYLISSPTISFPFPPRLRGDDSPRIAVLLLHRNEKITH